MSDIRLSVRVLRTPTPRRVRVEFIEFIVSVADTSRERVPLDPPKSIFPRAPNRPSSLSLRRRFHPLLGKDGRGEGERGIALESVWTPASWPSPPLPPPSTPVAGRR